MPDCHNCSRTIGQLRHCLRGVPVTQIKRHEAFSEGPEFVVYSGIDTKPEDEQWQDEVGETLPGCDTFGYLSYAKTRRTRVQTRIVVAPRLRCDRDATAHKAEREAALEAAG